MPRTINEQTKLILNDKNWLIDQHVNQLVSIIELSKRLKVVPNIIRKALRKFEIQSPSQQALREASNKRKYGVTNPGAVKAFHDKAQNTIKEKYGTDCWNEYFKTKREQTMLTKYGTIHSMDVPELYEKQKQSIIRNQKEKYGDTFYLLENKEWLIEQYVTKNLSIVQISKSLNIDWSIVRKALGKFDISIKHSTISYNHIEKLQNIDWLVDQHINQKRTLTDIAKELNVSDSKIQKVFDELDLRPKIPGTRIPVHIKEIKNNQLNDKNWLENEMNVKRTSIPKIAKYLCTTKEIVESKLKEFGIERKYQFVKMDYNIYDKLNDKDWLYDQHINKQKSLLQIATEIGLNKPGDTNSGALTRFCRKNNIPIIQYKFSSAEKEISDFIKYNNIEVIENTESIISPYELDIYIPSHNLAIEFCGLYWHNDNHKNRLYHRNKMKLCNEKNIRLLTIFENEWTYNSNIIKDKILSILKLNKSPTVFARKCKIIKLNSKQKSEFFNKFHIQQNGPGSINYGLLHNETIVSVISFIKQKKKTYILNRYATSCNVPGGFTKLLTYFKKNHKWNKITTFADLRWSVGKLYEQTGFVQDKVLEPDYQYVVRNNTVHKFNFRRKYLPSKLKKFNPNLSEWQNCKANNIGRIWDCGKKRFIMYNIL